jgi:K+-sensing histidine kinase KdpD
MTADGRHRGRLKVFPGAAAGVGKTFAMLGEARELRAAGVDVVIGYLEPHGRRATEDRAAGLEVAPRRVARVQGRPFAEMDTGWLLERLSCAWSTSWPTPTTPAAATPSAGRTSRSCWTPAPTSSPP